MKWAYIPIMFALAIAYTKISFTNLVPESISKGKVLRSPGRSLASAEQSKIINSELNRIDSSILFRHLSDLDFVSSFQKVAGFRGTIVGNPHAESFGFVIDDRSKASFGIREFQDSSEGLFLHDVLGHLVSVKTHEKKISWINYFDAYKAGLQDQPHIFSFYIEKGVGDAAWSSQRAFEENVSNDQPFEFTQLKKSHTKVSAAKKVQILNGLKRKYPRVQLFDVLEEKRQGKNYQVLARLRLQDKIQWLELIDSGLGEYEKIFNSGVQPLAASKKLERLEENIFEGKLNRVLEVVTINRQEYLVKHADNFSARLNLNSIPMDDYHDIFLDEAFVLGKIHRRSLGDGVDDYLKAWATIPGAVVDEKMIELKYRLKDLQE